MNQHTPSHHVDAFSCHVHNGFQSWRFIETDRTPEYPCQGFRGADGLVIVPARRIAATGIGICGLFHHNDFCLGSLPADKDAVGWLGNTHALHIELFTRGIGIIQAVSDNTVDSAKSTGFYNAGVLHHIGFPVDQVHDSVQIILIGNLAPGKELHLI